MESKDIQFTEFEISTPVTLIGGDLHFSYYLHNQEQKEQAIRLEYGLYYRRQNGTLSKKVFKISEKVYQAGEKVKVSRKQSFKLITTRKFYPGLQQLSVIVNGEEKEILDFELSL
jgi:hypothetical protein